MDKRLLDIIVCPICHNDLDFSGGSDDRRVYSGEFRCDHCNLLYEIHDEVPELVVPDTDLDGAAWETMPEIDEQLDVWVSANFNNYLTGNLPDFVNEYVEAAVNADGPVLDIASGPGGSFCVPIMNNSHNDLLLVMSDLGKPVMHAWRRHLRKVGWGDRCTTMACDARRLPFSNGSIAVITSVVVFSSVLDESAAYTEASRVLKPGGCLCNWIMLFEENSPSQQRLKELGWAVTSWPDYEALLNRLGFDIEKSCIAKTGQGRIDPADEMPLTDNETWEHRAVMAVRR
ncbi:MAG: methyltransferase domain-containing protein [Armatimonadota bacterium]